MPKFSPEVISIILLGPGVIVADAENIKMGIMNSKIIYTSFFVEADVVEPLASNLIMRLVLMACFMTLVISTTYFTFLWPRAERHAFNSGIKNQQDYCFVAIISTAMPLFY